MPGLRARAAGGVAAGMVAAAVASAACGDVAPAPSGRGDHLIVDVEASTGEVYPDASSYGDVRYGYNVDANGLLAVCASCACGAGTFCFAGGTGTAAFSGTCTNSSGVGVGCDPLPGGCANEPTCACILQALMGALPCPYAVCADDTLTVYCP